MPFIGRDPHETRTKIVCTIGPASRDPDTLRALIREGMDVARVNFSHGADTEHVETIARVRDAAAAERATVAVLADLQGPKLRIGDLEQPLSLPAGGWLALTARPANGAHAVVSLPHPDLLDSLRVGDRLLFGDGDIDGVVREVRPETVVLQTGTGGTLRARQGVAVPGGLTALRALTEKDRDDARLAVS